LGIYPPSFAGGLVKSGVRLGSKESEQGQRPGNARPFEPRRRPDDPDGAHAASDVKHGVVWRHYSGYGSVPDRQDSPSVTTRVFQYRATRGWSRAGMAARSGVSLNTIAAIEHGARPHRATLKRLAAAFGTTVCDLDRPPDTVLYGQVPIQDALPDWIVGHRPDAERASPDRLGPGDPTTTAGILRLLRLPTALAQDIWALVDASVFGSTAAEPDEPEEEGHGVPPGDLFPASSHAWRAAPGVVPRLRAAVQGAQPPAVVVVQREARRILVVRARRWALDALVAVVLPEDAFDANAPAWARRRTRAAAAARAAYRAALADDAEIVAGIPGYVVCGVDRVSLTGGTADALFAALHAFADRTSWRHPDLGGSAARWARLAEQHTANGRLRAALRDRHEAAIAGGAPWASAFARNDRRGPWHAIDRWRLDDASEGLHTRCGRAFGSPGDDRVVARDDPDPALVCARCQEVAGDEHTNRR
jgi:transcriptional regulator with XRE-family HTH domain